MTIIKNIYARVVNIFSNHLLKVMGKAEGEHEYWHGHVTAITVAPTYRRLHLAARMMNSLEEISEMYSFHSYLFVQ